MARKKEPEATWPPPDKTLPELEMPTGADAQLEFVRLVHWLQEGVQLGTLTGGDAWEQLITWLTK